MAGVHVVSKGIVKPSLQTPSNLKKHKLSLLDQIQPPVYTTAVFFYESDAVGTQNPAQIFQKLKHSLAKALTTYYPLAGKIDLKTPSIECSDDGALLAEARVGARLSDVLKEPNLDELKKQLPLDPLGGIYSGGVAPLFAAQVNFFECGGVSVGVCVPHLVADAASFIDFVREWANVCCNETPSSASTLHDFHALPRLSPALDLSSLNHSHSALFDTCKNIPKRYLFTRDKLSALKRIATANCRSSGSDFVDNPTLVELVTAFIWKEFIENNWEPNKSFIAAPAVNIRKRACKSLELENVFGNCFTMPAAFSPPTEEVPQIEALVRQLRKVVRSVNDEYTRTIFSCGGRQNLDDSRQMLGALERGEMDGCMFSSWRGFPFYEIDFGWGKPVWVCTPTLMIRNLNVLMDARDGEGVEAFMNMNQQNIDTFEAHFNQLGT